MKKYFPYLIFLSAICVSFSAAFYSVYGLSKLFSGATLSVILMASSLELSKLIIAGALHSYWNNLNLTLKYYLISAVVVLVLITSAGIYGFLSDAYQQTANKDKLIQTKIELIKKRQSYFISQLTDLKSERESVTNSISDLRKSLSTDNQYQTIDKRTGQILTQIQSSNKKGVQLQLDNAILKNDQLDVRILNLQDSVSKYDLQIIETEQSSDVASELGPLKYLSGLTGKPMDQIVNIFLILLIFVFDPLAISLVLLSLYTFKQQSEQTDVYTELPNPEPDSNENPYDQMPVEIIEPEKKKRGRPKGSKNIKKDEDENVESTDVLSTDESIEENENKQVLEESKPKPKRKYQRKVVDTNLTANLASHIAESLSKKKLS